MSSESKQCVRDFYNSDFYREPESIKDYLHPEAILFWNSSAGFNKMNYDDICNLSKELSRTFLSLRTDISHVLEEKKIVAIRFTYYVKTIENPDEELPMAHFIAIWEMKDGKLYKGHQISQQADDSPENLSSFLESNL